MRRPGVKVADQTIKVFPGIPVAEWPDFLIKHGIGGERKPLGSKKICQLI